MKVPLHLVEPLGFSLEDRYLKRAGLDYWPHVDLTVHKSWDAFSALHEDRRMWFCSKKAERPYTGVRYERDDILVFGRETRGLDLEIMNANRERLIGIPIIGRIRSYNLGQAVAIVLFEALRQGRPEIFQAG